MMRRILKRPQAERDIEEAFVYLAERDEDARLDFLFAVEETLELIAANPLIGAERQFDAPELSGIRMWRVKSYEKYLIFYFVRENTIELIRLIHSSLDYNRVLGEED